MKLQLSEIMEATVSELEDIDMTLAFEIEAIERQLSGNHCCIWLWRWIHEGMVCAQRKS